MDSLECTVFGYIFEVFSQPGCVRAIDPLSMKIQEGKNRNQGYITTSID